MDDEIPPELMWRVEQYLYGQVTVAPPNYRGAMMRALTLDPWRITARTHNVEGQAFVYVIADLDTRKVGSWEIPGHMVGVSVDADGDLTWQPTVER